MNLYQASFLSSPLPRGVARGGPGVPVTPLGRPSFEQTTYNIQVAKTHDNILAVKEIVENRPFLKFVLL